MDQVLTLDSVTVCGDSLFRRLVIEIEDHTEELLRAQFGDYLHIEPMIPHRPLPNPTD